jgi:hypothetical protein
MNKPCFDHSDFDDALPPPGLYPSTITGARFRSSRHGNRMLLVVHALDGVPPPHDRVSDYFALEGVSPRGAATARRRILRLYQACTLTPAPGDPIEPADLFGARLMVEIEHDSYDGAPRLKAVGYRRLGHPPF